MNLVAVACVTSAAASPEAGSPRSKDSNRLGLRPGEQLQAMRVGIRAAPELFGGVDTGCARVTPVLAQSQGEILAGNFRDASAGCYVWLNLAFSPLLNAREICKLALHEIGHLSGLGHSTDPPDVMFAPFRAEPVPSLCSSPLR
jgi:hypothetical protein